MTDFCDYSAPTTDCLELVGYLEDILDSLAAMPMVKAATSDSGLSSAELTALWDPCTPPPCAVVLLWNDATEQYEIQSYIGGTWYLVDYADPSAMYFTSFSGNPGALGDGWASNWTLDGAGNAVPSTPVVEGSELLLNNDFETWPGALPTSWTNTVGTVTKETTIVYSGSNSAKMVPAGTPNYLADLNQNVTVTPARWYGASVYGYGAVDGPGVRFFSWLEGSSGVSGGGSVWHNSGLCFDFAIDTLARVQVAALGIVPGTRYADLVSLKSVTIPPFGLGMNTTRDVGSDYGTFFINFTPSGSIATGILLNYMDIDNYTMVVRNSTVIYLVEVDSGIAYLTNQWASTLVTPARLTVLRTNVNTLDITYDGTPIVVNQGLSYPHSSTIHGIVSVDDAAQIHAFGWMAEGLP